MKKLIILFSLCLACQLQAQKYAKAPMDRVARKTQADNVPDSVLNNFKTNYASVKNVAWTVDSNLYMASFMDSLRLGHIITYNNMGDLVSTQVQQGVTAYPAEIEKYHDDHFPKERYIVWLQTDPNGNKMYYFTRNSKTVWFDPLGHPVERSDNRRVQQPTNAD